MNLLVKNWSGLLIVTALAIFSCEDSSDIGLGLDPDGIKINVLYTEIPLEATNVRIDSMRTSNSSRLLIGKNSEPIFGTTESVLFSQLHFFTQKDPTTGADILVPELDTDHEYVIDSTVISLDIEKVHSDDAYSIQHFDVHQLTDTIFSSASYFSNYSTAYNTSEKEGSFDVAFSQRGIKYLDSVNYTLRYQLDNQLGTKFFDIATGKIGSSPLPGNTLSYEYKGIAIVGAPSNTALIGIRPGDSTKISVYYHEIDTYFDGEIKKDSVYADSLVLALSLGTVFYNNITTDRSGSLMSNENGDYNNFSTNDGNVYLQPASGIYPKLNLRPIKKFLDQYERIQINRMEIVAEAQKNSGNFSHVDDLRYFYADKEDGSEINAIGIVSNALIETAILTDESYLTRESNFLVAPIDESTRIYEAAPTYFTQLVGTKTLKVDHAIVMPQDVTTPDFSIFDEETGFKVKLYYTLPQ